MEKLNDKLSEADIKLLSHGLEVAAKASMQNFSVQFSKAIIKAILQSTEAIDKVSTWLLVGSGATIGLLIANMDKIVPIVTKNSLRTSILILTESLLFGLLQKITSFNLIINKNIEDNLNLLSEPILAEHKKIKEDIDVSAKAAGLKLETGIDHDMAINYIRIILPRWIGNRFIKNLEKHKSDRLFGDKRSIRVYIRQCTYAVAQLICLVLFILAIALKLGAI